MNQNVVCVGIDVDDVSYHGSALNRRSGEVLDFRCRPTLKGLVGQLAKVHEYFGVARLKLCYEVSYVGFSLQRDVQEKPTQFSIEERADSQCDAPGNR